MAKYVLFWSEDDTTEGELYDTEKELEERLEEMDSDGESIEDIVVYEVEKKFRVNVDRKFELEEVED